MWWHTVTHVRGIEGETGECSVYQLLFTLPRNMVYPALLPLMPTLRLPVIEWTDTSYRFKWTRPFRWKTKSGFCACAITFRTQSTLLLSSVYLAAGGRPEIRVEFPVRRRSVSTLLPAIEHTQLWASCYSGRNMKVNTQLHLVSKYKNQL